MSRSGISGQKLIVLTSLLVFSSAVSAFRISSAVDAGLRYTDNADLAPSDEQEDIILDTRLDASLVSDDGPFQASADASLTFNDYSDNTFGDQYYWTVDAQASWEQIPGRLTWLAQNYFSPAAVDNLASDTPDNTEDINVFSFGPNLGFNISPRQLITVSPVFRDFYYETSDVDNQEYGLSATWDYQLYRTTTVGLAGDITEVRYDKDDLYPDYTSTSLGVTVSGVRARGSYNLIIGATSIDRDRLDDQDGVSGSLNLTYNMTGKSSVRAFLASDITSSSNEFLNSSIDPGTGDFSNVQTSGDVIRNSTFRLGYTRTDSTLNTTVWSELRDQDYKESPGDRDVQEFGATLSYRISSLVATGLNLRYNRTKESDLGRTDKIYTIGSDLSYDLSRKLRCNFDVRYQKKDSTFSLNEYDEFSVFAGLGYIFGE